MAARPLRAGPRSRPAPAMPAPPFPPGPSALPPIDFRPETRPGIAGTGAFAAPPAGQPAASAHRNRGRRPQGRDLPAARPQPGARARLPGSGLYAMPAPPAGAKAGAKAGQQRPAAPGRPGSRRGPAARPGARPVLCGRPPSCCPSRGSKPRGWRSSATSGSRFSSTSTARPRPIS